MRENMQDTTTNDIHHADAVNGGDEVGWTLGDGSSGDQSEHKVGCPASATRHVPEF